LVNAMVENSTGEWLWRPGFDLDGDGFLNATGELRPRYAMYFEYMNQTQFQGNWYQSHFALDGTLEVIGDVPASVLILHGEGDQQGPVSEAFLLEQRLTEVGHPDHTLITYPGLGHTYYPVDRWLQLFGPPEDYVLSDLATWLKDPGRNIRVLETQLETTTDSTEGLQSRLDEEQTKINMLDDKISDLEGENVDLRNALSFSKNLNYVSIGIAVIAVVMSVLAYRRST